MDQSSFDLKRARRDTPGCENVIHFNNAGAALMPQPVLEVVTDHLKSEAFIGGYEAADLVRDRVENVYDAAAALIGAAREEIAIIENATRAWDMAFYSIPFRKGDRILTAMAEYASNYLAYLQVAKQRGIKICVVPNDEYGQISISTLQNMIDERVKLIAITHVPTNGGLVNPASKVGEIAKEEKILYLLDACQSVGHMPINVEKIGCDLLSATGRKYLRGPRGTGFLYVKKDIIEKLDPPFIDLHAAQWTAMNEYKIRQDARRFENWETSYAGKIGLGTAIDYARGWGIENIWKRIIMLAEGLRCKLNQISGVNVRDLGEVKCGIVSFTVDKKNPVEIKTMLNACNINVSVSVLPSTRLDMESRSIENLIRASVHYYNSEDEIDRFCTEVASII